MRLLWVMAGLSVLILLSVPLALAEDDEGKAEGERRQGGGSEDSAQGTVVRTVTKTVYLPDPVTEKNLTDALAEVGRLKIQIALQNTTIEYLKSDGQLLSDEISRLNGTNARLKSDVNVLTASGQKRPQLNESLFLGPENNLGSPTELAADNSSTAGDYSPNEDKPLVIRFLLWLNLI
jgi:hypothetical protein